MRASLARLLVFFGCRTSHLSASLITQGCACPPMPLLEQKSVYSAIDDVEVRIAKTAVLPRGKVLLALHLP